MDDWIDIRLRYYHLTLLVRHYCTQLNCCCYALLSLTVPNHAIAKYPYTVTPYGHSILVKRASEQQADKRFGGLPRNVAI